MSGRVVGIDLGTSNSVVSTVINGEPVVIPDAEGRRIHPSVVAFLPDGTVVVGRKAKSRLIIDPANTVYSAKRLIGRPFYAPEVKVSRAQCAYDIERGADDNPRIAIHGRQYSIEEIQALVLRHVKKVAETYLGEEVSGAVITVPANFNEAQRLATKTAGEIAGLRVLRILNEPTAAALAYGYDKGKRERISVYDLGGGTFDVTILELRDNVFEVLSTAGNTYLGGDDFDQRIVSSIVSAFRNQYQHDLSEDSIALQRLKALSERVKCDLSERETASIEIKEMLPREQRAVTLNYTISRDEFEERCHDLVQRTFVVCDEGLKLAGLTSAEIDHLVLVGGSTRVPIVRRMVQEYFFREPLADINPDEVVAIGAAIYASTLDDTPRFSGEYQAPAQADALLIDVTPHSLGVETLGGYMDVLIERNARVPCKRTRVFTTSADDQTQVRIRVYEGEGLRAEENDQLGELLLYDLEPLARGEAEIEVTFRIDADGILNVEARDVHTGQSQHARLSLAGTLSEEDIDEILDEQPY